MSIRIPPAIRKTRLVSWLIDHAKKYRAWGLSATARHILGFPSRKMLQAGLGGALRFEASIIIPVYNKAELTRACLTAIKENTSGVTYEVIVVNNASTDDTDGLLGSLGWDNLKVINNKANLGYAKANNQGAQAAEGSRLVFLNNDTVPLAGWLKALLDALDKGPRVGVVGAKLIYPETDEVQHAGMVFSSRSKLPYHVYQNFPRVHFAVNRDREFQAVTGACLLMPRGLFFRIGMFDEMFVNGGEDTDLCLKVREMGYRVVYAPACEVYHYEGRTPGRGDNIMNNRRLFVKRWGSKVRADDAAFYEEDGFAVHEYVRDPKGVPEEIAIYRPSLKYRKMEVLIVKPSGIGNMILFTPAMRALRDMMPEARLTVACHAAESVIIKDLADEVVVLKSLDPSTGTFDHSELDRLIEKDRFFMALYPPFTSLGGPTPAMRKLIPVHITHPGVDFLVRHEVLHNMDIVRMLGYTGEVPPLYAPTSPIPEGIVPEDFIAIHAGGSPSLHCQKKKWPLGSWAGLISGMPGPPRFVMLGGKGEEADERDIISLLDEPARARVVSLVGKLSLIETASVIKSARLMISNDSGLMHLASAVGTPVIGIFGPTIPAKNSPWGDAAKNLVIRADMECSPCYQEITKLLRCPDQVCLTGVTVDMVLKEATRLLSLDWRR